MFTLVFQTLLKAFFENISSIQAAFRRAAANMILATCLNCRKPQFFLNYVLKHLLGNSYTSTTNVLFAN